MCALPTLDGRLCGACLHRPRPFAATVAALIYTFPVDRLLHTLKYRGQLPLADWAAGQLVHGLRRSWTKHTTMSTAAPPVDCIVALPLAPARQSERGFNQAQEIARRVAGDLGVPMLDLLSRSGAARPQAELAWSERVRNVRGAFRCRETMNGLRVALIDDVMTTGASLAEAARALRRAGAASVECWVVARTLAPGQAR